MSKKAIKAENPELTTTFFGALDTSIFLMYGVAQFFTGAIGDMFNRRVILTVSFFIQAVFLVLTGFAGTFDIYRLWYFCPVLCVFGFVQSVDFPCLVGTLGNWTTKSTRGTLMGIWSTQSTLGNIIGLQLSVVIVKY